MKSTEYTYDELDAHVRSARVMRAHAIRDFFRSLFTVSKPKAAHGGRVRTV